MIAEYVIPFALFFVTAVFASEKGTKEEEAWYSCFMKLDTYKSWPAIIVYVVLIAAAVVAGYFMLKKKDASDI